MKLKALNLTTINKIDKAAMLNLLLDFPEQCARAAKIAEDAQILFEKRDFKQIVFAGLGGSAIGGDLVRSYLYSESRLPIMVFREYDLPNFIDKDTLVFISSYSGNTEETLSAYQQSKSKGATIIGISSNGKVRDHCQESNFTFIGIPAGFPPRCAVGYLSIIPLLVLEKLGFIKSQKEEVKEVISLLSELRDKTLSPKVNLKDNIAKRVARRLVKKMPFIYSASVNFDVVVARLRAQISENANSLASSHLLPEMNHNEIVGWQNPKACFKNFVVLMLSDQGIHPRVKKRMEITKALIKKEGVELIEFLSRGNSLLARIYSLVYIGDFISFYLAISYGIDPTPVERIGYLKSELAKG